MTYEEVFSYEHLFKAGNNCCNGVRWKQSTQNFEMNMASYIYELHEQLMSGTYKSKGFNKFTIMERGKVRKINSIHITERCVQKCLCTYYLKPLLDSKLIYDNSASRQGKGTDFSIKRLKYHLSNHYKHYGKQGGILLLDYHDYFASIDREILKQMLKHDIDDEKLYNITCMFIDDMGSDRGLGLGSEVYQILAIYYPNKIDHFIKEQLHIKGYGRYMDDSYIIHQDIDYLRYCKEQIEIKSNEIGLELNSRSQIIKLTQGFNFLKKRWFITDNGKVVVRLVRKNITTRRRTLKRMTRNNIDTTQSYNSWKGYAKHYNSYNSILSMEKLYTELGGAK